MNISENKSKLYDTKELEEKFVLIGIDNEKDILNIDKSLDELEELVLTAGATIIGRMIQKREAVHKGHYFGKGKVEELKAYVDELGATGIVCDDELTATQMRNLENLLNVKVLNRTLVILDIFAKRAVSAEGKVQVELAQLKYKLSHLTGQGKNMSRLGGGIGSKGPGEKKLETDKRSINNRIAELSKELKEIEKHRQIIRDKRIKNKMPVISFVGYTNAGKSTLMNAVTNADVLAMNKLFATLDTTTRKIKMSSGQEYLFTDTVGFIQKLPHNLIQAFKSTLEETKYADVLVHVVDATSPSREEQMKVVYKTLKDLNCLDKPILTLFNKIDLDINRPLPMDDFAMYTLEISAKNNIGIEAMLETIENIIKSFKKPISVCIPYSKSELLQIIHTKCEIISNENREDGMYFEIYSDEEVENKLRSFII